MRLDQVVSLATAASLLAGIYDGHVRRKAERERTRQDDRVRVLEERIARLEGRGLILDQYGRPTR